MRTSDENTTYSLVLVAGLLDLFLLALELSLERGEILDRHLTHVLYSLYVSGEKHAHLCLKPLQLRRGGGRERKVTRPVY